MQKVIWKQKSSRLDGYEHSFYAIKDRKVYRIDYSLPEQRVRFLLEEKNGKRFWSEIHKGKQVRSNFSLRKGFLGKSAPSEDPLSRERDIFSTLPVESVLKLANGHHQLDKKFQGISLNHPEQISGDQQEGLLSALDKKVLEVTRHRFFHRKEQGAKARKTRIHFSAPPIRKLLRYTLETTLVLGIVIAGWSHEILHLQQVGGVLASSGILFGGVDMFIRDEDPFLPQVLFLAISGGILFFNNFF